MFKIIKKNNKLKNRKELKEFKPATETLPLSKDEIKLAEKMIKDRLPAFIKAELINRLIITCDTEAKKESLQALKNILGSIKDSSIKNQVLFKLAENGDEKAIDGLILNYRLNKNEHEKVKILSVLRKIALSNFEGVSALKSLFIYEKDICFRNNIVSILEEVSIEKKAFRPFIKLFLKQQAKREKDSFLREYMQNI